MAAKSNCSLVKHVTRLLYKEESNVYTRLPWTVQTDEAVREMLLAT